MHLITIIIQIVNVMLFLLAAMSVIQRTIMLRCPEIFLAGCTSAAPDSASFRQNKDNDLSYKSIYVIMAKSQCG